MQMDFATKQNLELTQSIRNNANSTTLWSFLDKCKSSMGSRTLRKWIEYPLLDVKAMIECSVMSRTVFSYQSSAVQAQYYIEFLYRYIVNHIVIGMRRGQSLVVWAIHEGREAAKAVDEYLNNR